MIRSVRGSIFVTVSLFPPGPSLFVQNGTGTDNVSGDINDDGQLTILKSFNDWDEVHQYLADEDTHPKQTQLATP